VSVPLWASELAQAFWAKARETEPFPRNLRRPIAQALPLAVVLLAELSVRGALQWLQNSGIVCAISGEDRPLRGCLFARHGHGIVLVDGSDGDAQLRFSIAHELAHFLRDYWGLRRRICNRLGAAALEVLEGERSPTSQERLHALLQDVPLGFHLHLMERNSDGKPATSSIAESEKDADRLAFELLAPAEHVLAAGEPVSGHALVHKLRHVYGLPGIQASQYASVLLPPVRTDPLLLRLKSMA
jgi:hypothetical protein